MYKVYVCEEHGTMLKKCCEGADNAGWFETAETDENK